MPVRYGTGTVEVLVRCRQLHTEYKPPASAFTTTTIVRCRQRSISYQRSAVRMTTIVQ